MFKKRRKGKTRMTWVRYVIFSIRAGGGVPVFSHVMYVIDAKQTKEWGHVRSQMKRAASDWSNQS